MEETELVYGATGPLAQGCTLLGLCYSSNASGAPTEHASRALSAAITLKLPINSKLTILTLFA